MTGPLDSLADFAASLRTESLPLRIIEKAQACVLYGVAVGIAGCTTVQPAIAKAVTSAPGSSTRFIDGARLAAGDASFANGVLFHARCQEDAHPTGHLGTVVLPAALAEAELRQASGAELLAAIVVGYEVALRIGRDHAADLSARGFRTTSVYGVFAAAATAARLRRLDAARMQHALALAANMSGGLRAFVAAGSDEFPYQAGLAARNGMLAAALAAEGAEGPRDALCGDAGFYEAFGGKSDHDYAAHSDDDLGIEFEMEQVACKPYPTCQFHRGVVDLLLRLRQKAPTGDASRIEIRMHPLEAEFWGVRYAGPFTSFPQTFMSAPFCAAVAWTRGQVRLADMFNYSDPSILGLLHRVAVIADMARPRYCPAITVDLYDGSRYVAEENRGSNAFVLDWRSAKHFSASLAQEVCVPPVLQSRLVELTESLASATTVEPLIKTIAAAIAAVQSSSSTAVGARSQAVRLNGKIS